MGKLTERQRTALRGLSKLPMSAYAMRVTLGTMNSLSIRGFVRLPGRVGDMAFPRNAVWEITDAGRAALEGAA